jgi:hypothetical protein
MIGQTSHASARSSYPCKQKEVAMKLMRTILVPAVLILSLLVQSFAVSQNTSVKRIRSLSALKAMKARPFKLASNSGNRYVRAYMSTYDGSFTIGTADGRALLFGYPDEGATSWTTVRVDSTYYNNGGVSNTSYFPSGTASIRGSDSSLIMKWTLSAQKIDVTQILTPVLGDAAGSIWIQYQIKNNDTKSHTVGVLLEMDTEINDNDEAMLSTSYGLVSQETTFTAPRIPTFWQAFEGTPSQPGLIGQGTLTGSGAVTPDEFIAGSWTDLVDALWDYKATSYPYDDSAVLYQWNLQTVAAGATITVATFYGTGSVSISQGVLTLNLAAPSSLSVVGHALSPNPFDVVLNVQNTGSTTANNITATINLPSGLTLASGTITKSLSPTSLATTKSGIVSWSVLATGTSRTPGDTLQYSISVTGTSLPTFSIMNKIFIPAGTLSPVERLSTDLPTRFSIDQNYPNPFNPSTTIRYEVPHAADVALKIYNTLGQVVATLVDEKREAGYFQVQWNADVPSGIYFYRFQAGEFVETRKMVLLR